MSEEKTYTTDDLIQQLKEMHVLADTLFAELITMSGSYFPSRHPLWPIMQENHAMIAAMAKSAATPKGETP